MGAKATQEMDMYVLAVQNQKAEMDQRQKDAERDMDQLVPEVPERLDLVFAVRGRRLVGLL